MSQEGFSKEERGFTLIELLIVVAIIGIVSAITTPALFKMVQNGKQKRSLMDLKTVAQTIAKRFVTMDALKNARLDELTAVPEIGERIANSIIHYFSDPENRELVNNLRKAGLKFEVDSTELNGRSEKLSGKTFVISGTFEEHSRDELKSLIEQHGGKYAGSVSGNTDYLLAGENMGPSKRAKAEKLNITIISEKEFMEMIR